MLIHEVSINQAGKYLVGPILSAALAPMNSLVPGSGNVVGYIVDPTGSVTLLTSISGYSWYEISNTAYKGWYLVTIPAGVFTIPDSTYVIVVERESGVAFHCAVGIRTKAGQEDHVEPTNSDTITTYTVGGTVHDGVVLDLAETDGTYVTAYERGGAPGSNPPIDFELKFAATNTALDVSHVIINGRYDGSVSHTVTVYAYDYAQTVYVVVGTMPSSTTDKTYYFHIPHDCCKHDTGETKIRFKHSLVTGVANHTLKLDSITLVKTLASSLLTPEGIASSVWGAPTATYTLANTFGGEFGDVKEIAGNSTAATSLSTSLSTIASGTVGANPTTTTIYSSELSGTIDHAYTNRILIFTSGELQYRATNITAYNASTKVLSVGALPEAPAQNDTFIIV